MAVENHLIMYNAGKERDLFICQRTKCKVALTTAA